MDVIGIMHALTTDMKIILTVVALVGFVNGIFSRFVPSVYWILVVIATGCMMMAYGDLPQTSVTSSLGYFAIITIAPSVVAIVAARVGWIFALPPWQKR